MIDIAHEATEKKIKSLERKLKKEYYKAYEEVVDDATKYFMQFEKKDAEFKKLVESGEKTKQQYIRWRNQEMLTGEKWKELENRLAIEYQNADKVALSIINNNMVDVYALNRNYIMKRINKEVGIDITFSLYDRKTVERLILKKPNLLPKPSPKFIRELKANGATLYDKSKMRSLVTRSIIKGDNIETIAKTLSKEFGQSNLNTAIRQARTMMTAAQNGGRNDGLKESAEKYKKYGYKIQKQWVATSDNRTRDSHADIDGDVVDIDDTFDNELEYPGDLSSGDPSEVLNCRCTMVEVITEID